MAQNKLILGFFQFPNKPNQIADIHIPARRIFFFRAIFLTFMSLLALFVACSPRPAPTSAPIPGTLNPTPQSQIPNLKWTPNAPVGAEISVGWAYEAYPDMSGAQMLADMTHMKSGGATSIWIGHNNPGDVDATKGEPGLSFAVWYALLYESGPRQAQATQMANAVRRALDAARAAGLKVVLPIGYQIMMGATWNALHPDALRKTYDGRLLQIYGSPPTASPYSSDYQQDIGEYYKWIEREWVEPYRDTVQMLSLSDEPQGGDYSTAAKQEFARRYGKPMESLVPDEQWKLGEFEAGVVADFAAWSAYYWKELDPKILTTISFHSGDARSRPGLPEIEPLFSRTPSNFAVTFDTYLHDDLPTKPATDDEIAQLELFLTTLGRYSAVYHKPLVLWGAANTWGLAQQSGSPLDTPDALTNLLMLYDLPARAGGDVRGIYAWNYNVKQQGLYNFAGATTYQAQALEAAVQSGFRALRARSHPAAVEPLQAAIIASPRELYAALTRTHSSDLPPAWFDYATLSQLVRHHTAAVVTPGLALGAVQDANIILCVAHRSYLDGATTALLKTSVAEGKIVLVWDDVASALQVPRQSWTPGWRKLPESGGVLYVVSGAGLK